MMSDFVMLVVLCAALLHATWNAMVKGGDDNLLNMVAIVLGHLVPAVIVLWFVPFPAAQSLPWLAGGIILHVGYQLFLVRAYQIGDLTQVYPIARGVAPLIVTLVSVLFLGLALANSELIAIVLIALGIASICLVKGRSGSLNLMATLLALTTGLFIASYSLVDGTGARLAGSVLGFYAWQAIGNAIVMLFIAPLLRPNILKTVWHSSKKIGLLGGGASFFAYALVIWAFTQAPIALVTALREVSIVFALLIGTYYFKERMSILKVFSTFVTLAGVVLLRFGR